MRMHSQRLHPAAACHPMASNPLRPCSTLQLEYDIWTWRRIKWKWLRGRLH